MAYKAPRKGEQAPVVTDHTGYGGKGGQTIEHPAFGQISVSRITAGGAGVNLYGSDFGHGDLVSIEIKHSQLNRELNHDWYFPRDQIVNVYLSAAQWAVFVSSFNVGSGVPCTINWEKGEGQIPEIPPIDRAEVFKKEMADTTNEAVARLEKLKKTIEEMGLPKKKADELLSQVRMANMSLVSSIPFVQDQFDEHVETTIEKSKIEVENYLTTRIQNAGIVALQKAANDTLALDDSDRLE